MLLKRLKSILYSSLRFTNRLASEKIRWRGVQQIGYRNPRVYYGHDHLPSRDERSGGAMIKFQDLQDEFPNTLRNANILYLVNSALPEFPEIMVREAKKKGVSFVLNQNGVAYPGWHGEGWEKKNRPMRYLLKNADYVIYQSEFCKVGADKFLAPCKTPWTVLYNPVNTQQFVPGSVVPSGSRILLAGSHQHFYRVRTALEALKFITAHRPEATLTIAGRYTWHESESECIAEAKSFAKELGIIDRVFFGGAYTQTEAPELFQNHHILLHTKYNDPCPRLVIEAMACGLPIVYSQSGGVHELVGNQAGIGIPSILDWEQDHPPGPVELAEATMQILASLKEYAASARKRAETCFDVKPWRESHAAIFKQIIKSKNHNN